MEPMGKNIENEIKFCEESSFERNKHNQFIYISKTLTDEINLSYVLQAYKEFLIENNIVKEI